MSVVRGPAIWWGASASAQPPLPVADNIRADQLRAALRRAAGHLLRLKQAMDKNVKEYWAGTWSCSWAGRGPVGRVPSTKAERFPGPDNPVERVKS